MLLQNCPIWAYGGGAAPLVRETYIFIIYRNYTIPYLLEYFLKISLQSVHNCKRWQSPIDHTQKSDWIFISLLQYFLKIKEIK